MLFSLTGVIATLALTSARPLEIQDVSSDLTAETYPTSAMPTAGDSSSGLVSLTSSGDTPSSTYPTSLPSDYTTSDLPTGTSSSTDAISSSSGPAPSDDTTSTSASASASATSAASTPLYTYTPPNVSLDKVKGSNKIRSKSYKTVTKNLPTILHHAVEISNHSWELGALNEALLEVYNPDLAPFEFDPKACEGDVPWAALQVSINTLGNYTWTGSPSAVAGDESDGDLSEYLSDSPPVPLIPQPLVNGDGALGDPVAPGVGIWILSKYADREDVSGKLDLEHTGADYAWAVANQLFYLQNNSKADNGTISQRDGYFELWSDMGYMIPPFPAYLGLDTDNTDLLKLGIDQWLLESSALLDTTKNIFLHILNGDVRHWATGNAWMAYGAVRLLASIEAAGKKDELSEQVSNVEEQLSKLFPALFAQLDGDSLLPCYMFESNATLARGESAGTTLSAAAYYRFLKLAPHLTDDETTKLAEKAFDGVIAQIDSDGWLGHVVDPLGTNGFIVPDYPVHSPEGQSFIAHLWAARTAAGV